MKLGSWSEGLMWLAPLLLLLAATCAQDTRGMTPSSSTASVTVNAAENKTTTTGTPTTIPGTNTTLHSTNTTDSTTAAASTNTTTVPPKPPATSPQALTTKGPTPASTTSVTTKATTKSTTADTTTNSLVTSSMSSPHQRTSGFDLGSFIGGIVLMMSILAILYFGCRFYNSRRGVRYRTIDEHEAII